MGYYTYKKRKDFEEGRNIRKAAAEQNAIYFPHPFYWKAGKKKAGRKREAWYFILDAIKYACKVCVQYINNTWVMCACKM